MLAKCRRARPAHALARARRRRQTRSPAGSAARLPRTARRRADRSAPVRRRARPPALWHRDPSVWSDDPAVQQKIANRLGWLSSPALMADSLERLRTFAEGVQRDGFTDVVLLGMGGSSLAPEVLRAVSASRRAGRACTCSTRPIRPPSARSPRRPSTRCICSRASRERPSSRTRWPRTSAARSRCRRRRAGPITSSRSPTKAPSSRGARARERFRDVFINPSDIGGRYSALSFFGMVPAALMGQDVDGARRLGPGDAGRGRAGSGRRR